MALPLFNPVPTQKMPRLLTTSASACRRLLTKAELMGIDVAALEFQEAQVINTHSNAISAKHSICVVYMSLNFRLHR